MRIVIGEHEFAWSLRTSGFPLNVYDSEGNLLVGLTTSKRARIVEVPDEAKYLVHFYESNRGRRYAYVYELLEKRLVKQWDESDAEAIANLAPSDMNNNIKEWILGVV